MRDKSDLLKLKKIAQRVKKESKARPMPRGRSATSRSTEALFKAMLKEYFGSSFRVAVWGVKERTLAKRMSEMYGADLMTKAVRHYFETWDDRVAKSNGRLRGVPTMGLMWAMKDQLFGEIQMSHRPKKGEVKASSRDSDEYSSGNIIEW